MQVRCSSCFYEYEEAFGMCPNCGYVEGEECTEAYCLTPGTWIADRYKIGAPLGLGGFGITYKALDVQLNTVLAIKEYFPCGLVNRTAGDPTVFLVASKRADEFQYGKRRFLDEARNMAKFSSHHNIVNVFNYFEANNTAYIVMEYLDGMTLSQTLQAQNEPLSVERCVSIAIDICDALESIHSAEILHRDVSPDNIMLCKDGTVKLFDFGAARFSMDAAEESKVTVIVKPGFAPPEQYDRVNQQDARTDLYALGATLYYALTGIKPEESTNRKIKDSLQSPQALIPEIPAYFSSAIMRALALEPQYRFESAEAFRKVLQQKIEVSSVSKERKKRLRRRVVGIVAALMLVAVAFAAFWWFWQRNAVPAGELELWYITTGDNDADAAEAEIWTRFLEEFNRDYPDVTVTAIGIPEKEYSERINKAKSQGKLPEIYESTGLGASAMAWAPEMQSTLFFGNGIYLDGLEGQRNSYPTGLIVPVIYVNRTFSSIWETKSFSEMATLCKDIDLPLTVSSDAAPLYQQLYGNNLAEYVHTDALNQFVNGRSLIYCGTSADFQEVQQLTRNGNGQYAILFPQTGESVYTYGCLWSCSEMDATTTRIAQALLGYMNSDRAQDYFNIRGFDVSKCVPATESAIERFIAEGFGEMENMTAFLDLPYVQ